MVDGYSLKSIAQRFTMTPDKLVHFLAGTFYLLSALALIKIGLQAAIWGFEHLEEQRLRKGHLD